MKTTEPNRNFRIPRKLLPLIGILAALFAMLALCGWSFGNSNANNVKFVLDHHERPVVFTARSIPKKLKPGVLLTSYQAGRWDGKELTAKGVKVKVCDYGTLCYRLACQRTTSDGELYDSSYTVIVPVYVDIPANQQSALIAEGDAVCADITEFVQFFSNHREVDPYSEHTSRHATGALMVFGNNRIELYRGGALLDTLLFKQATKVNLFSHLDDDDTWITDIIVYADGKRYTVHDNGKNLVVTVEGNVVYNDDQGNYFATYAKGVLRAYSDPHALPGKAISGVTVAKTVSIPTANPNIPVKHYLAYMKGGQMYLADYLSLLWREGTPCGTKVSYKTLADLQVAIDTGELTCDDFHLKIAAA